jgi:hypothetical protein
MLSAIWVIKGLVHVNWLPRDARINSVYFQDEILIPISWKLQANTSGGHTPWTLVSADNAKVHTAKVVSSVMPDLRLKRALQLPYSPDICPSDFLLVRRSKGKLQQQQFTDQDQLFDAVDEMFASLSVDLMGDVFRNWIHWLAQIIASDGDCVQ